MPLVVMCGFPNSGKSVRAVELIKYLSEKHPNTVVKLISEDSLERAKAYKGEDFALD